MRVRFWGTRGSIATPGAATVRYGGNTSCVEVRANDGTRIVLDCGTGARVLGQTLAADGAPAEHGHLLIGHTHWDHIQGFPFFAPLHDAGAEWHVYGPRGVGSSLRDTLAGQMSYSYFPVDLSGMQADVRYHELVEGELEIGDVRVTARYLNHPAVTLGYRLEADGVTVVYATDHEPHSRHLAMGEDEPGPVLQDDAHAAFLEGADLVIHDCQYIAEEYPSHAGYGHSTVEYVVDRTHDKGVRQVALFHHDPMRDDDGVERILAIGRARLEDHGSRMKVLAAAEGTELELLPAAPGAPARRVERTAEQAPAIDARAQQVIGAIQSPQVLTTFEDAASADDVSLTSADTAHALVELARSGTPSVVLFEPEALGQDVTPQIAKVREAATADVSDGPGEPIVVGLIDARSIADPELAEQDGVDEWVQTPITPQYARSRLRGWLLRTGCRWRPAPWPADEAERLDALHDLGLLDTPPEERFDRLTRIAARAFDVPMAFISLVDADRQWFKSKVGLDTEQTPRDQAFCAHAILGNDVFEVQDARSHEDFADSPLVTGSPFIRFYAGVPLVARGGATVGTLCLFDHVPRRLSESERELLRELGALVQQELTS